MTYNVFSGTLSLTQSIVLSSGMDIVWFNDTPDTFRSFRRRWGDCGISQDCSRSQCLGELPSTAPQCVRWCVVLRDHC